MGVYLAGSYNRSLRPLLGSAARRAAGIRRLVAADGAGDRSRAVQFSEWRGVLDALAALPKFAAGGSLGGLPSSPAALNTGRTRSASLASAHRVRPDLSTKGGWR